MEKNNKLYRWVKASERLPEEVGKRYHLIVDKDGRIYKSIGFLAWKDKKKGVADFYQIDKTDWNNYPIEGAIEWLEAITGESEDVWDEIGKRIMDGYDNMEKQAEVSKELSSKYLLIKK